MASIPYDRSTSESSYSEKSDPEKKDESIVSQSDENKPAWQRMVLGDAKEGYDTQRALKTRHMMMIGASLSLCSCSSVHHVP